MTPPPRAVRRWGLVALAQEVKVPASGQVLYNVAITSQLVAGCEQSPAQWLRPRGSTPSILAFFTEYAGRGV